MFVHDRFVFLQMRKTGSTFLADALRRELPTGRLVGKHKGWGQAPREAAGRPALVYVRNPWDWYVSWYHFNMLHREIRNPAFHKLSAGGTLSFAATIRRACVLDDRFPPGGIYTVFFKLLTGAAPRLGLLSIGRFEALVDDLMRFLFSVEVSLVDGAIERIRAGEPLNRSDRGPYRDYYDDELRDLVGTACRPFIERFGYEF